MSKIDMEKRYRELIAVQLEKITDEQKLHELYVYALTLADECKNGI